MFSGANAEQLRQAGLKLKSVSETVSANSSGLRNQWSGVQWDGQDRLSHSSLVDDLLSKLLAFSTDLSAAGTTIVANAADQEISSGIGSGAGGGLGVWSSMPVGAGVSAFIGASGLSMLGSVGGSTFRTLDFAQSQLSMLRNAGNFAEMTKTYPSFGNFMSQMGIVGGPKGFNKFTSMIEVPSGVGSAFDVINVAKSGFALGNAMAEGDVDGGVRAGLDVGWTIGGAAFPPVGMGKAAWDVGFETGKFLDEQFHISDRTSDAILGHVTSSMGGVENMTVAQGTEIGRRYDGISGFGHFVTDGVGSFFR